MSERRIVMQNVKRIELRGIFHFGETLENQGLKGTALSLAKANICLDAVAITDISAKVTMTISQTIMAVAARPDWVTFTKICTTFHVSKCSPGTTYECTRSVPY